MKAGSMNPERDRRIVERHLNGEAFRAIGSDFGISHERVHQIVRRAGVTPEDTLAAKWVPWECEHCSASDMVRASAAKRRYCSRDPCRDGPRAEGNPHRRYGRLAMSRKPIRVFYSTLSGRFYAADRYRVEERDGKEFVTITGKKHDVTDDIARAVMEHELEFFAEYRGRVGT